MYNPLIVDPINILLVENKIIASCLVTRTAAEVCLLLQTNEWDICFNPQ